MQLRALETVEMYCVLHAYLSKSQRSFDNLLYFFTTKVSPPHETLCRCEF